jgi:hypothetical protein
LLAEAMAGRKSGVVPISVVYRARPGRVVPEREAIIA